MTTPLPPLCPQHMCLTVTTPIDMIRLFFTSYEVFTSVHEAWYKTAWSRGCLDARSEKLLSTCVSSLTRRFCPIGSKRSLMTCNQIYQNKSIRECGYKYWADCNLKFWVSLESEDSKEPTNEASFMELIYLKSDDYFTLDEVTFILRPLVSFIC